MFIVVLFGIFVLNCYVFAGILHTVVFHRALGLVRPKDVDMELFDVTYVCFEYQFVLLSL